MGLKRKREGESEKTTPSKRIKVKNFEGRIKKFETLNATQENEILRNATSLVEKYYKGSHPNQVHKFISEISKITHKIKLLKWIGCMGKRHPSLIKRTLDMLSEDPSQFNQEIRDCISISDDLYEKSQRLSRFITTFLKSKPKDYTQWMNSTYDKSIHESHIHAHYETRREIQEKFKNSNLNNQFKFLNDNLDRIIKISYSKSIDNQCYSFEKIKEKIIEINIDARLTLLQWMLFYTNIDTMRLINLLIKYDLPLDKVLIKHIKNFINKDIKPKQLSTFRQVLTRREEKERTNRGDFQSTDEVDISEDNFEMGSNLTSPCSLYLSYNTIPNK